MRVPLPPFDVLVANIPYQVTPRFLHCIALCIYTFLVYADLVSCR